jgi:DNA (cytosine-5)-methyltransferase 1
LQEQSKPRLLDLFCGAGGAARGYQRAGFYVIGVDIAPQPRYAGDEFIQADAMTFPLDGFDVVHASPPCQAYSDLQKQSKREYPDLVAATRERLSDRFYVIENVESAPLINPVVLCGTMFDGLRVLRHRGFESPLKLATRAHGAHPLVYTMDKRKAHYGLLDELQAYVQVTGGGNCSKAAAASAMGIDWMTKTEMNEAIPPAYAEYIGRQLMEVLA